MYEIELNKRLRLQKRLRFTFALFQLRIQDFPLWWVRQPSRVGVPTKNFDRFFRKVHEIERIWMPRGNIPCTPLDTPMCLDVEIPYAWISYIPNEAAWHRYFFR